MVSHNPTYNTDYAAQLWRRKYEVDYLVCVQSAAGVWVWPHPTALGLLGLSLSHHLVYFGNKQDMSLQLPKVQLQ